jgi:hypothetical protein
VRANALSRSEIFLKFLVALGLSLCILKRLPLKELAGNP